MPSATVPDQYAMIGTILDPPLFSLDTTFKKHFCSGRPYLWKVFWKSVPKEKRILPKSLWCGMHVTVCSYDAYINKILCTLCKAVNLVLWDILSYEKLCYANCSVSLEACHDRSYVRQEDLLPGIFRDSQRLCCKIKSYVIRASVTGVAVPYERFCSDKDFFMLEVLQWVYLILWSTFSWYSNK